jgi:ankyrin repeat protein
MEKKELKLIEASKNGDFKKVKKALTPSLFSKKINIEIEDDGGRTPLILAVDGGHKEIVEFLISKKANIEANKSGLTPVMIAAQKGYIEIAEVLVLHKADINRYGSVMVYGDVNVSVTTTALILAVQNSHYDMISFLLEREVDVDSSDLYYDTALHHAVKQNNIEIAKLLISKNSYLNQQNKKGYTPLIMAVFKRQLAMVELLVQAGSDVSVRCLDYKSAFDYAKSSPRITEMLQKAENKLITYTIDKMNFNESCSQIERIVDNHSVLYDSIHLKMPVINGSVFNEIYPLGFRKYRRENKVDYYWRTDKYELITIKTDEYDYELTWLETHITGLKLIEIATNNAKVIKPKG